MPRMTLEERKASRKALRQAQPEIDEALSRWRGVSFEILGRQLNVSAWKLWQRAELIGQLPDPI